MTICLPVSNDYLHRLDGKLNRCRDYTMNNYGKVGRDDIVTVTYRFDSYSIHIIKHVSGNKVLSLSIDLYR